MKIEIRLSVQSGKRLDLIGVGCFETAKDAAKTAGLTHQVRQIVEKHLRRTAFSGKAGETLLVPSHSVKTAEAVLLIGLGKNEKYSLESVRRATARLLAQAKMLRSSSVGLELDTFTKGFTIEDAAAAAAEGARLANYRFDRYKSKPGPKIRIDSLTLIAKSRAHLSGIRKSVAQAETLMEAVTFTRDLANEPANVMTPVRLAGEARAMARGSRLSCKVLGRLEMRRLGMHSLLGVAQGSVMEPQLIILEHKPAHPRFKDPIVLVGKGITFDTGGISIKPSNDMDKMKFDMCGAAAVIGTMKAVARLKLPVRVIAVAPVCENMPGGRAQRPGDIVRALNGKTIEVLNTDAEGRLILADALAYTARLKPKVLVDIATLTGACAATFGDQASGLMSTDEDLADRLKRAGERTGERVWQMPMYDEYAELIRGTYADIQNISRRSVGIMTAGFFLKEFADHTKTWAHLDVAGTAWADHARPMYSVGATGMGVRLFVELIKSYL